MVLGTWPARVHGACMVVPGEAFDPLEVLEAIQAERCTSLYGVPTMFIAVLDQPRFGEFDLSTSLRTGIMAGAPCPIELMQQVVSRLHMPEVAIGYGMTETSPISTRRAVDDPLEQPRRHRRPRPAARARSRSSIQPRAASCRAAQPASSARAATA